MKKIGVRTPWTFTVAVVLFGCPLYISLLLNSYIYSYFLASHPAVNVDVVTTVSCAGQNHYRNNNLTTQLNKYGGGFFPLSSLTSCSDLQVFNKSDI